MSMCLPHPHMNPSALWCVLRFLVATLTPFDSRGRVDLPQLRAHVLWLSASGVDGFVPTGTTGEFLYLSDREREAVHRTVLDAAGDKPVYPCTWDPSPQTTAYLCDAAREQGAAGVLLPPPLYYKLDEAAAESWYRKVADTARIKILAYHHPRYIPTPIGQDLFLRLRRANVLAGLKDSSTDLFRLRRFAELDQGGVWAGGDRILGKAHRVPGLAGFISGLGNVWPSFCKRVLGGEEPQLEDALIDRCVKVRNAGGLRAMKGLVGMGCRAPLARWRTRP